MSREKKDDSLQAVVIVDAFDVRIEPDKNAWAFTVPSTGGATLLDYTLEWLSRTSLIHKVLLCCTPKFAKRVKLYCSRWSSVFASITCIECPDAHCTADCVRELDRRSMIAGDFLLTSAGAMCVGDLTSAIEQYRARRRKDKNAVLTLIRCDIGEYVHDAHAADEHALWQAMGAHTAAYTGIHNATGKLLFYRPSHLELTKDALKLPKTMTKNESEVSLRRHLLDPFICICSAQAATQFSDNFDFQTLTDLIAEILVNEEVLGQTVHVYTMGKRQLCFNVNSMQALMMMQRLIHHRVTHPLVPDCLTIRIIVTSSVQNIALRKSLQNVICPSTLLGERCVIDAKSLVENSILCDRVHVDANTCIRQSFIGNDVRIGKMCIIQPFCYVGDKVHIPDNTTIAANSILICRVDPVVAAGSLAVGDSLSSAHDEHCYEELWPGVCRLVVAHTSSHTARTSSAKKTAPTQPIADDELFANEVYETLKRGYDDKLSAKNLALEINGSRFAYNVSGDELVAGIVGACIAVAQSRVADGSTLLAACKLVITAFAPVLVIYIKTDDAQMQCLEVLEKLCLNDAALLTIAAQLLHVWYECDILNEMNIVRWYEMISNEEEDDDEDDDEKPDSTTTATAIVLNNKEFIAKLQPFISWLKEADEEESDEGD